MKTTFGFNENNNNDGAVISPYIPQISTKEAKLRIATNGMPDIIPSDTVVYDIKTQQLYVGNGKGLDPALFSNIHVIENKAALPKEAVRNNLYITLEEGIITVYDPVSKAWKQIQGGGEGGVIEKQIQIYSSRNDFPKRGTEDKLYIAKDTMYGYVYDTDTDKYISLVKDSYTKAEIDSKIAKIQTVKGDKGDQGENGKSAYELAKEEGYTGTQKQWLDSLNGTAGKSAYQIAKDNGFAGDETKWLESLKGERGATGAAGAPGVQGPPGEPGQKGEQGPKGDKGDTGETGATGPQGVAGKQGKSAYQIAKDNGFEGSEQEWLASLKGQDGDGRKGDKGDPGKSAFQIAQDNGFTGNQTEWLASLKGADGAQGPQGIQGIKGDTGVQGEQGIQGEAGKSAYEIAVSSGFEGNQTQWLQSLKGERGEQGPQGEPGQNGTDADMSNIYTKAEIDEKIKNAGVTDLTAYATKEDIKKLPTTESMTAAIEAAKPNLDEYVKKTELPKTPDMSSYAKAEDVTPKAEIQKMIDAAIDAYKKSLINGSTSSGGSSSGGSSGGSSSTGSSKPPISEETNQKYAWTKYFVVPHSVTNISGGDIGTLKDVFGEDITCTDLIGTDGSDESIPIDTTNTTTEIRILGTIKEDPEPGNKVIVYDSFPTQFTWAHNYTEIYKDGMRVPFDDLTPADKVAEYNKILNALDGSNTGAMQYDGEDAMNTSTMSNAVAFIYLIRKLKTGTFAEYEIGEKITQKASA